MKKQEFIENLERKIKMAELLKSDRIDEIKESTNVNEINDFVTEIVSLDAKVETYKYCLKFAEYLEEVK